MEVDDSKGMVCVTGGTGYVASWLIMKLLQHGYSVNATIRSTRGHKTDVSYLTNLPRASQRLRIFTADLDKPESFTAAIEGCIGVFHVAHPMNFGDQEIEDEKIREAVDGTLGILRECLKSKTVKRVVYTSSRTTLVFNDKGLDTVDESSWSDISVMKTLKPISTASYVISKTLAEKAALEFAEKHGLDLVTVIPSWIHGPFLSPRFPESLRSAMAMIFGIPLLLV
uniref:Dihydroflavonol 4-reductase n=1 Tax=Nicotiana tabacum TaxID=4097 RepID=A0A1S4AHG6_TOBAC|nr:PREDICTED: vestitone reductase-like [Nicotiana tabacum]XP_016476052.1 PREDICTED: vestitone reductase-like [Nicotiana tabacum]XP_016476053.1 PREDICTED: vestitone reductase-like [Nicotiana tabacum]XP_016476054.1 PREDICTED: vestitone reductase-like [Nicotiana tabacum]